MKAHVIFNILIQFFIIFLSVTMYFDNMDVRLLYSMFIIGFIFLPQVVEFSTGKLLKEKIHYTVTLFCLILFTLLTIL